MEIKTTLYTVIYICTWIAKQVLRADNECHYDSDHVDRMSLETICVRS